MNNRELYVKLRTEIGATGTVYYGEDTYRERYVPAHIMEFKYNDTTDGLRVRLLLAKASRIGYYEPPMDNVSIAHLYLPSPMNSRFHGDMVPLRTYFEMQEREGCHSCKYGEVFDIDKEPCKYCYGLSQYTKKEEKMKETNVLKKRQKEITWKI